MIGTISGTYISSNQLCSVHDIETADLFQEMNNRGDESFLLGSRNHGIKTSDLFRPLTAGKSQ